MGNASAKENKSKRGNGSKFQRLVCRKQMDDAQIKHGGDRQDKSYLSKQAMGQIAVERLTAIIERKPSANVKIAMTTSLVKRGSL